jgi:hypothetical protein
LNNPPNNVETGAVTKLNVLESVPNTLDGKTDNNILKRIIGYNIFVKAAFVEPLRYVKSVFLIVAELLQTILDIIKTITKNMSIEFNIISNGSIRLNVSTVFGR